MKVALALLVLAAPTVVAQQATRSAFSTDTPTVASAQKPPLPKGFFTSQALAGAAGGGIGALIGGAAGALAARTSNDDDPWGLNEVLMPIMGALLGYIVGTPIGVWHYSRTHGVDAPIIAPIAGAAIGTLGFGAFFLPGIVTVPVGATLLHNARTSTPADTTTPPPTPRPPTT